MESLKGCDKDLVMSQGMDAYGKTLLFEIIHYSYFSMGVICVNAVKVD